MFDWLPDTEDRLREMLDQYYDIATAQWARQWPVEDLWAAHLAR